jgi:hypothetical protein
MSTIPICVIEEHHEAYLFWGYSLLKQWIQPTDNILLHMDEHSDLSLPRFDSSIRQRPKTMAAWREFTYHQLGIASFIYPAVYQKIFNEICWVNARLAVAQSKHMHLASYRGEGKVLAVSAKELSEPDALPFLLRLQPLSAPYAPSRATALDIDIDFFSSDDRPKGCRVEITREQRDEIRDNPYHMLRLMPNRSIKLFENDGKYYLLFDSTMGDVSNESRQSEPEIRERAGQFKRFLEINAIKPSIITICRSRFSGFTPADQWEFIETTVLECLRSIYDVSVISIAEIARMETPE